MRPRLKVIDSGQAIFAPIINGKTDYFFMHTNRDKMFRSIKEYMHISKSQFFEIGGRTKRVKHPEKRKIFFDKVNQLNEAMI